MKWYVAVIAFNVGATIANVIAGNYGIAAISAAVTSLTCILLYQRIQLEAETARIQTEIAMRQARLDGFKRVMARWEEHR